MDVEHAARAPQDALGGARCAPATDEGELEALLASYGACCYGLARSILRDAHLAQDAVQEAFLDHWRREAFDETRSSLRSWLLMLTHRKAVDRVRLEQRRATAPMDLAPDRPTTSRGPEELALADDEGQRVRAALATLSAVQREALTLAYWGGYTQREVAALTGAPLGTVKTRMLHGMLALRRSLVEEREG